MDNFFEEFANPSPSSPKFEGIGDATVTPPEIREADELFHIIEFYVDLSDPRPDLQLFDLVRKWLAARAPLPVMNLSLSYHVESVKEPPMLVGLLLVGEPIDVG